MANEITDKIVLITGGAGGIGYSCAQELLRNGARGITLADVNAVKGEKAVQELTQEFGANKAIFVKVDVNKTGQLEAGFKVTLDFWKSIDVVINNAAIHNDNQWELEITLNCKGVVQGTLLGLQYMGKDSGGRGGTVINVASILAFTTNPYLPVYCGTKHFVMGFTRSLADAYHYNRTGVKMMILCPGLTDTDMMKNLHRKAMNLAPDIGEVFAEEVINRSLAQPKQPSSAVGLGVIALLAKGKNGDIWVSEENKPIYQIHPPHWRTFEKI